MAIPNLSIITVNLNDAIGLRKTIESVVIQTYTDYEHIIIDGGSADGSIDVIKEYSDKITYWVSEADKGIYNAMNKGIKKAKGEYLQFLNSGDWLVHEKTLEKVFEIPRIEDIVYGHLNIVYERSIEVLRVLKEDQLSLISLLNRSLAHPSSFINKSLFIDSLYDESFEMAADKKFFIEKIIFKNCTLLQIDEIIVNFNSEGVSSKIENHVALKKENDRILAQVLPARMSKEYKLLKSNYSDIQYLVFIKKYKITLLFFKVFRIIIRLFMKHLR